MAGTMPLDPVDVARPGVPQDPGVKMKPSAALPAQIQDPTGPALANFGQVMSSIGASNKALFDARQGAEDKAFLDTAQLDLTKHFTTAIQEHLNSAEAAKPNSQDVLDKKLADLYESRMGELTNVYTPTVDARRAVDHVGMSLRINAAQHSAVEANNQRISFLLTDANKKSEEDIGNARQGFDVQATLDRIDSRADSLSGMVKADKLREWRDARRAQAVAARIEGLIERGKEDPAQLELARQETLKYMGTANPEAAPIKQAFVRAALSRGVDPAVQLAIVGMESSWKNGPSVKEQGKGESTASGYAGFTEATARRFGLTKPASGYARRFGLTKPAYLHTEAEQAAALAAFTDFNTKALRSSLGREPTPAEIYYAHHFGDVGALNVIKAANRDPSTPIANVLSGNVNYTDNPHLKGKTVGDVAADLTSKMQEQMKKVFKDGDIAGRVEGEQTLPASVAAQLHQQVLVVQDKRIAVDSVNTYNAFDAKIHRMSTGEGAEFSKQEILSHPLLDEARRNHLVKAYDSAMGNRVVLEKHWQNKFLVPNAGSYNPTDKVDEAGLNDAWRRLGGDENALRGVLHRDGKLPSDAVAAIHQNIQSTDPQVVQQAFQKSEEILTSYPHAFENIKNGDKVVEATVAFRHRIESLGGNAGEASRAHIEDRTAAGQERRKLMDAPVVDKLVKTHMETVVSADTIGNVYDQSILPFNNPGTGQNLRMKTKMLSNYEQLFREYLVNTKGDSAGIATANDLALRQLKRIWGVSNVNGTPTVQPYPPEMAPGVREHADSSKIIAELALKDLKSKGIETTADKLVLLPVGGATSQAFLGGRPVPYVLTYLDKDGVMQFPRRMGDNFIVDAKEVARRQTEMNVAVEEEKKAEAWRAGFPYTPPDTPATISARAKALEAEAAERQRRLLETRRTSTMEGTP